MGQTTSNIVKKVNQWATGDNSYPEADVSTSHCLAKAQFNPFVYKRQSPMYIDGDGDVAHEFYEQERITYKTNNGKKRRSKIIMKKIPNSKLTPLGMEDLPYPSINVNYPHIICDASIVRPPT